MARSGGGRNTSDRNPGSRPHRRPRRAVWAAAGRPRRRGHQGRASGRLPARRLPPLHDGVSLSFAVRNAGKKSVDARPRHADEGLARLRRTAGPQRRPDPVQRGRRRAGRVRGRRAATRTWWSPRSPRTGSPGRGRAGSRPTASSRRPAASPTRPASRRRTRSSRRPRFADDGSQRHVRLRHPRRALAARDDGDPGFGQVLDCSVNEAIANMGDWSVPNNFIRLAAGDDRPGDPYRRRPGVALNSLRRRLRADRDPGSPRQWHAMRAWLGEPDYLQDPELDYLPGRLGISDRRDQPAHRGALRRPHDGRHRHRGAAARHRLHAARPLPADVLRKRTLQGPQIAGRGRPRRRRSARIRADPLRILRGRRTPGRAASSGRRPSASTPTRSSPTSARRVRRPPAAPAIAPAARRACASPTSASAASGSRSAGCSPSTAPRC